jgi:hypothetical protein
MSFDNRTPTSSPPPIYVSPALVSMILVVGLFLFATWQAFSTQKFAWLALIPGIPLAVFFLNRRDYLFLTIVMVTASDLWLPTLGNDVAFHIFLRWSLVIGMIGAAIIARPPAGRWDVLQLSLYGWLIIILLTMAVRGTGIRQLGSPLWGGRAYIILLGSLLFLIATRRSIRLTRRQWLSIPVMISVLPLIPVIADLVYIASGGKLYFLYYIFKPGGGVAEAATALLDQEVGWRVQASSRVNLLPLLLLAMPGLQRTPHGKIAAALIFMATLAIASMGGFRGALLGIIGVTLVFAWLSAPHRRGALLTACAAAFLGLVAFAHFAGPHLPSPMQRVLTIVPFSKVDPTIRMDADHSSQWRINLWQETLRTEVRPHLLIGRGLSFDPNKLLPQYTQTIDEWLVSQNFITTGTFHNGPLGTLVLFGIPGLLCLLTLMFSAVVKHLRIHRMEWHDPLLRQIHLVFLCYVVYGTLSFLLIFGDLTYGLAGYFASLGFLEMLDHARREAVDTPTVAKIPAPLVPQPPRNRAIRFT